MNRNNKKEHYEPQEVFQAIDFKDRKMTISILKETLYEERRVALIPGAVSILTKNDHNIKFESNAGINAFFDDIEYSEAGAEICYNNDNLYDSEIILKVEPPTIEEIKAMKPNTTIISSMLMPNTDIEILKLLSKKKITAIAWDLIKDKNNRFPAVSSMGEIAGLQAISTASYYLSNTNNGRGKVLGGIAGVSPAEIVIIGAGTVGEQACRSALSLGASVKVFDQSIYKLRRLQNNINLKIWTSIINPQSLQNALKKTDVAIGCVHSEERNTPCFVSEEMVMKMKPGSVIVDISIDRGGVFETSRITSLSKPSYIKYGVIHYCVPNIASTVSRTSSVVLSNYLYQLILDISKNKGVQNYILNDSGFANSVFFYNGHLTNESLSEKYNVKYRKLSDIIFF